MESFKGQIRKLTIAHEIRNWGINEDKVLFFETSHGIVYLDVSYIDGNIPIDPTVPLRIILEIPYAKS